MSTAQLPDQFIVWKSVPQPGKKPRKVPSHPVTGNPINHLDPSQWMSYETAVSYGEGVGFVLTENDPYFLLDLDNQRNAETGEWTEAAVDVAQRFKGAAMEISVSQTGMHVMGVCDQSAFVTKRNKWGNGAFEFYSHGRFVAMGNGLSGNIAQDCTEALLAFIPDREDANVSALPDNGPVPEYTGPTDDETLIQMMLQSRGSVASMFGNTASLASLWKADAEVLSKHYPSETDTFDRSSTDAALCAHLAFWTGKDVARIERLWLQSPLARSRPDDRKLSRSDYRAMTVTGAAQRCSNVYMRENNSLTATTAAPVTPDPTTAAPVTPDPNAAPVTPIDDTVGEYMTVGDQVKFFDGCVYIEALHGVLTPSGRILSQQQFKVIYGGHEFQMQADGSRPTRNAWECFTESRCYRFPKAHSVGFNPDLPHGAIVDGKVNTFKPADVHMTDEPVDMFLSLLNKLLPDPTDREILMSWCASMVQNPGKKFQWAVVIQGAQGNGKTFILKCLEYAMGESMSHLPNPEDMDEKYNGYIRGNLFIGVEEIHMGGRRQILDRLKKYITNSRVEVREMGIDKYMTDNLTNWMFLTNYKDAVLKSKGDRRYAVFFTAQQEPDDLIRDGMGGDFFPHLWKWAREGGFAAIAGYLKRYDVNAAYDPLGACHRAPNTSSTDEAINASMSPMAQVIQESIDSDMQGFRGGWISSTKMKEVLYKAGYSRVFTSQITMIISELGYEKANNVPQGRVPASFVMEGARSVLYTTKENNLLHVTFDDYKVAQGYEAPKLPS